MSKMSEIDMMVQDVVEMVEDTGCYLKDAMPKIKTIWGLDDDEFDMVYAEANHRIYG